MADMRISMMIELNAQRARAEAAALRAEIDQVGKTADAAGRASGSAAGGIDRLGASAQTAAANASTAGDAAKDWASAIDVIRQAINPLEADLVETLREMRNITVAEEIGALTAREAALAHDQLMRSVTQLRGTIETANAGYDANGAAIARAETAMQRMIAANTGIASSTSESIAAELKRGYALDELQARFDPLFAASRRYELELREINDVEHQGTLTAAAAGAARERAAAGMAPALRQIGGAAQSSTAYVAQLGYQVNDIGVMLASGQNPLVLAMQQGTQVNQVFDLMREKGQSVGQAIKSSLLSMVSPMNLLTIGAIALGAYAVQAFMGTSQSVDTAKDAIEALTNQTRAYSAAASAAARPTQDLKKEFGEATAEARSLLAEIAQFEAWKASKQVSAASGAVREAIGINLFNDDFANQKDLIDRLGLNTWEQSAWDTVRGIQAAFRTLRDSDMISDQAQRIEAQIGALKTLRDEWSQASSMDGKRTQDETNILALLNEQLLAVMKQRTERAAMSADLAIRSVEDARAAGIENTRMGGPTVADRPAPRSVDGRTGEAIRDANALIEAARQENELARLKLVYGERSVEVRAEEQRQAMAAVETRITELGIDRQGLQAAAMRTGEAVKLALAEGNRIAAQRTATDQLRDQYATQARIVELSAKYGADSLEVAYARAAAERETQVALLASQGIAGKEADELMRGWDAAQGIASVNMAAGISDAADAAMLLASSLGVSMQNALGLMGLAAGASKKTADAGLSYAIGSPEAAAAAAAAAQVTLGYGDNPGTSYKAPSFAAEKAKGGGGKGAETSGVLALIEAQQRELAILREVDPVKQEMLRNSEALAKASLAERAAVETLIRTRVAEESALEKVRDAQNAIGETGKSLFVGLANQTMTWVDALDTVLSKLAEMAASSVWDMIWNGQGGSGGLGALVTDWLGGSILAKADGGRISGPGGPRDDAIPAWVSNGEYIVNAAATARALPLLELINAGVPVDRLVAAIGGRGMAFADGGYVTVGSSAPAWARSADGNSSGQTSNNRPMQVQINNYGSDQIEAQQTTGPDGEEIIAITVGKQMSRGRFDKQQRARYGTTPQVARR
jgi:hypothetical protein